MKIAINTGPLESGNSVRGIGFHTKELLSAINKVIHEYKNLEIIPVDLFKVKVGKYDLVHYTSFNPYFFSLPFKKQAKRVVLTIHDLIYLVYPDSYPPGIKGKIRFFIQKLLIRSVDKIITISNASKADIVKFLGVSPERVSVVYLAAKGELKRISTGTILHQIKTKYHLPEEFVLYVGDINYNKNIPTLMRACRIANVPLVIVGKQALDIQDGGMTLRDIHGPLDWIRFVSGRPHPELAHYSLLLEEFKKSENVFCLGFVPDNDLSVIYSLATVYCQPSYYEGFGLPLLEAMVCGLPVVASRIGAHVEIGEEACLYVNPHKPEDVAQKITSLFTDTNLRNSLIKKGFAQVKRYSWEKTARETLKVYEETLEIK